MIAPAPNAPQTDGDTGGSNFTYCDTDIRLIDTTDICAHYFITGLITTIDGESLSGISTFQSGTVIDIIILQRHILGVDSLETPQRLLAADVNRSGDISVIDLIQMKKLILNQYEVFPNNTSWRFIDASYDFGDTLPFNQDFPESITVDPLSENIIGANFIGVKIGDLNGSAEVE